MTKDEQYIKVLEYKADLESKINLEYLPLQKQMDDLLCKQDLQEYIRLESIIAPMRSQIEHEYDELLRMRRELEVRFKAGS